MPAISALPNFLGNFPTGAVMEAKPLDAQVPGRVNTPGQDPDHVSQQVAVGKKDVALHHRAVDAHLPPSFDFPFFGLSQDEAIDDFLYFDHDGADIFLQGRFLELLAQAHPAKGLQGTRVSLMKGPGPLLETEQDFDDGRPNHLLRAHAMGIYFHCVGSVPTKILISTS
jgi:hypothetical protein